MLYFYGPICFRSSPTCFIYISIDYPFFYDLYRWVFVARMALVMCIFIALNFGFTFSCRVTWRTGLFIRRMMCFIFLFFLIFGLFITAAAVTSLVAAWITISTLVAAAFAINWLLLSLLGSVYIDSRESLDSSPESNFFSNSVWVMRMCTNLLLRILLHICRDLLVQSPLSHPPHMIHLQLRRL